MELLGPTITLLVKSAYGRSMFYPNCEKSFVLAELLKQRSFTQRDIEIIKRIGIEVKFVHEEIKL